MSRLRLGMIGCGAVAELYHLPVIERSDEVLVEALVDPQLGRAEQLARRYGGTPAADWRAVADRLDLAIVATPNALHAPTAIGLIEAGVHVLVEKPLAPTTAECAPIAAAAEAAGVVVAVGHDFRWFPVAQTARAIFEAGLIGAVETAELRQAARGRWPYASTYVFSREQAGGGVLLDFGVHMLDLLAWWLGPLGVVRYADDACGGVETECSLELRTEGGADVLFELTRLRVMRDTLLVHGSAATLEIGIFEPALLRLTPRTGGDLLGDTPDPAFTAAPLRTVFSRQLSDFVAAVGSGGRPLVTVEDGSRAVALVEQAYALRQELRRPWDWPEALAATEATAT